MTCARYLLERLQAEGVKYVFGIPGGGVDELSNSFWNRQPYRSGQVARAMGASHIIMTDVLDYRLQLAKKLGADVVVNVANEDPQRYVDEATDAEGADVVIEATGLSKTILQTMNLVRSGGTVHIAGLNVERLVTEPPTFFVNGLLKEVTVEFSTRPA